MPKTVIRAKFEVWEEVMKGARPYHPKRVCMSIHNKKKCNAKADYIEIFDVVNQIITDTR